MDTHNVITLLQEENTQLKIENQQLRCELSKAKETLREFSSELTSLACKFDQLNTSMKIHEQITPENWCQNHFTTESGARCASQWIESVYKTPADVGDARRRLVAYLDNIPGNPVNTIVGWNDDPKRTFEEVKTAFKECDL